MDHNSGAFYFVMALLIGLGVFGTAIYYFFRFGFRTDHDKDIERVNREQSALDQIAPSDDNDVISQVQRQALIPEEKEEVATPLTSDTELGSGVLPPESERPLVQSEPEKPKTKDMSQVMEKTRQSFFNRLKSVFSNESGLQGEDLEDLEEILYTSDLGPQTVQRLMDAVEEHLNGADKRDLNKIVESLKSEMAKIFSELQSLREEPDSLEDAFSWPTEKGDLQVWLIVGVNGAGKTTTIGKLANLIAKKGLKAMVAAGDTFRAAAGEQLKAWSERAQVEIFSPENVTDPSAVAFDACSSAKAKGFDVVIIDTAGRLHTHKNLMEELKKMKRVVQKVVPEAPHEALLVLDANSGQNALIQAKEFNQAIELTGAVLTKLDGSAKGGVAVGLAHELSLPVRLIGVGEGIE
ncbi:MAG: signal recognition particle-docking protein FtsY, partial [Pseudomonadota bacterium]